MRQLKKHIKVTYDCYLFINGQAYGSSITLENYVGRSSIYIAMMFIQTNNKYVTVKIGFSVNITKRIRDLEIDYKTRVILLDVRFTDIITNEKQLHHHLRKHYPHLILNYSTNGTKRIELYMLSNDIIKEFCRISLDRNEGVNLYDVR